jgi:hypothetical protein
VADWPGFTAGSSSPQAGSAVGATGIPTPALASAGTAHTKNSAWTELIATAEHPCSALLVQLGGTSLNNNTNWFIDIGLGAGGSEAVLIPNLWVSHGTLGVQQWTYLLPCEIPKGSRIAARASGSSTAQSVLTNAQVLAGHWLAPSNPNPVRMYGGTVANSGGVSLTPGASALSAWQQVTAATEFQHSFLTIVCGKIYTDTALTDDWLALDVGIGGSGSETVLVGDLPIGVPAASDTLLQTVLGPLPVDIPKGTRLSIRARGNTAQTGYQFVLYGMG